MFDGKRLDGVMIAPWRSGRPLVWVVTCPDTFAISYAVQARGGGGGGGGGGGYAALSRVEKEGQV